MTGKHSSKPENSRRFERSDQCSDLWPFDGSFGELLARGRTVFVETYPGDVYGYVGAEPRVSKRVQRSRAASAKGIVAWAHEAGIDICAALVDQLHHGFSADNDGEDRFDAVIGLLGMLAVVQGQREVGAPKNESVRRVEGWILGRAPAAPFLD